MDWMDVNRFVHVAFGFTGLAAFWIPVFVRKGGRSHRLFGKVFKVCAYVVLAAAGLSVTGHMLEGLATGHGPRTAPGNFAFLVFLGYLALVTWIGLRHGIGVLSHKQALVEMATPFNRAMAWLAIAASAALLVYTAWFRPPNLIVLLALSPIGFLTGRSILKALNGRRTQRKAWFYEHMENMIGTGIAFHTAFAVFGSNRIFQLGLEGWFAVIPWILPALIGIPAITIWIRYYQRKFGDLAT